jgi:Uma2 family endonuclease
MSTTLATPKPVHDDEAALVLGPELAGTLMTPEEFDAADDAEEGYVYELINGVLVVSPSPSEMERGPNELLGVWLYLHQTQHPEGRQLDATLPEHTIRTTPNRRRADRAIWIGLGRMPNRRRDLPTIVVEFVSAGRRSRHRDYVAKRDEYLAAGIAEYWVIDRFRRTLTAFRAGVAEAVVPEAGTYQTPRLPGFVLRLADLLAAADRWAAQEGDEA